MGMLGDGDLKAFDALQELAQYPGATVMHEEWVNHVHKWLSTALLKLSKTTKLGDEGHGCITNKKALRLQQYYRATIAQHTGDVDGMHNAMWATLFHCMSTDEDPHDSRYPAGIKSWCFYQRTLAVGEEPDPHATALKHPLTYDVAEAMLLVYMRMSDPNLLK